MTTTTASTSADRISQSGQDLRLAAVLRLIVLILGVLAAAAGVAYVLWGDIPKPAKWENQVATVIWAMPLLSFGGALLAQFYPRTGAVLLGASAALGLVLALGAAGFPPYLATLILLSFVAAAAS